ncbi:MULTISPECIES: hypothetical protein [Micrococcaceae]|jgi:hypothetical protein|uniref:hypothetical protein n=1 Tax=Micrococcaceae TaxID=1268 RepID=UPI000255EF86|nr:MULTISPECIES: hypothetical protein [Micrococcaceae]MBB5749729.1 uncharacterized protein YukE [Micrococcus sp. TA1]HRO29939.1 hypothetical protein [Citricoccus sp.]HRO93293.1 hypothetical protein [Citricoccus sp.]
MSTISYDSGAAASYEAEVAAITGRIEGIIGDRESQKNYVASNYQATDNDADYDMVEQKWLEAADAVRALVVQARELMEKNDDTAATAHSRASGAIAGMRA